MTTEFIPGRELSRLFYQEVVRPLLAEAYPGLRYSAALIGYGSDVLGYDTERSTDHEWGPRVWLFLSEEDYAADRDGLLEFFRHRLPYRFRSYSTSFTPPRADASRTFEERDSGPVNHKIEVHTLGGFFRMWLGFDPRDGMELADWLTLSEQKLLEVTGGSVYHDGLRELERVRAALTYYPHDLWLYLMAAQWRRISQQEAFVGRTVEVSDELGSRLITAALVRDLMRLCFLQERTYAPYSKWFGTAFGRLRCAGELEPHLAAAVDAASYEEREASLCAAYETVARMHNALGVTPPLDPSVRLFYDRPFRVINADRFSDALHEVIADPAVRALPRHLGSVDQIADSTDVLSYPKVYRRLRSLYEPD
jgi:hypothetical protein